MIGAKAVGGGTNWRDAGSVPAPSEVEPNRMSSWTNDTSTSIAVASTGSVPVTVRARRAPAGCHSVIAPIKADAGAPPSTHGSSFGAHAIVSIGDAVSSRLKELAAEKEALTGMIMGA